MLSPWEKPRVKETRWGWQRGGERRDARDAQTEREGCGLRFRPHSLGCAVQEGESCREGT